MKTMKFRLAGIGLLCFLIWLPNPTSGRVYFRMSFGTPVSHYPCFHHFSRPHYRWYGYDCDYRWIDRDYYRWLDSSYYRWSGMVSWRHHYWPDYYICPPEVIVIEPPVVISRPRYNEQTAKLFEQLRQRKAELRKELKSEDKEARKEAIDELAGFSFDEHIRKALEEVLFKDPDPEIREAVVKSFSKVKNRRVLPALEKARIEDENKEVRQEADRAIKKIKSES